MDIERPAKPENGDLATSLAMKLARPYRMAPLRIAEAIAAELAAEAGTAGSPIASVEVAPAGLPQRAELVAGVAGEPRGLGVAQARRAPTARQRGVRLGEPHRALHIGNARGAFVGDLLCRVLEAAATR